MEPRLTSNLLSSDLCLLNGGIRDTHQYSWHKWKRFKVVKIQEKRKTNGYGMTVIEKSSRENENLSD